MAYMSIAVVLLLAPLYDALVADRKQQRYDKTRMNAVENAGILHGKLTGGRT